MTKEEKKTFRSEWLKACRGVTGKPEYPEEPGANEMGIIMGALLKRYTEVEGDLLEMYGAAAEIREAAAYTMQKIGELYED